MSLSYLKRFPLPVLNKYLESIVLKVVVMAALGQPHLPGKPEQAEEVAEPGVDILHEAVQDGQPLRLQLRHALR